MAFTDTTARNAKPGDKAQKLSVGGGLYLLVQPNGSKLWRYKYRIEPSSNLHSQWRGIYGGIRARSELIGRSAAIAA